MSIDTKKLVLGNFFNESKKLATMLKNKEFLSDLEQTWLESYNIMNDYYESMNSEYFFIISEYSKEPIGTCSKDGITDVHKEERKATFVKCTEEEADLFGDSDGEVLPLDFKERKIFDFEELNY